MMYGYTKMGLETLPIGTDNLVECLLFGALISATDPGMPDYFLPTHGLLHDLGEISSSRSSVVGVYLERIVVMEMVIVFCYGVFT